MPTTEFCPACNNLLYPKADNISRKLMLSCRRCGHKQASENPVVYKNEIIKSEKNQLETISNDIITDPTLSREPVECPECMHTGAVLIMPKIGADEKRLRLIYVCTNPDCVYKWQN